VSKRRELSTVIGMTGPGRIYQRHVEHAIGAAAMRVALRHCQRHLHGPMLIIWERCSAPRAVIVKEDPAAHPEIALEWLPP
jgi:hypothetical protein